MDEIGQFYRKQIQYGGTHLVLRLRGRVRYIVPREAAAQHACWKFFHPGRLELPLRAMAYLPRLFGAVSCVEAGKLTSIREAMGNKAGLSCYRSGAPGPWSKDTILLLDKNTAEPLYIVKAGVGEAANRLLKNEAYWLRSLRSQASLVAYIPELVAHRSADDFSFVAELPLLGQLDFKFGELHLAFLRKLQEHARQVKRFEESRLYLNLRSRLKFLNGLLPEAWSSRLDAGMRQIVRSFSKQPMLFVAAHNDFTPWNIRVKQGVVRIFDWEYADYEQLPLFDPLHFALMPMTLNRESQTKMIRKMRQTQQLCTQGLRRESCCAVDEQSLAYFLNLCTLYLWADRGQCTQHPTLISYARLIDYILCN